MKEKVRQIEILLECADLMGNIDPEVGCNSNVKKIREDLAILQSFINTNRRERQDRSMSGLIKKYPSLCGDRRGVVSDKI